MRILLYGINFSPELTGAGKYSGEMAEWLAVQGHSVDVITAPPYYPAWKVDDGYSAWRYLRESTVHGVGQVDVLRCPLWVPGKVTGLTRMAHLATFAITSGLALPWGFARRPDLVFVVAPTMLQVPMALLWSALFRVPAWLHIQDFEVDAALEMGLIKGAESRRGWKRRLAWSIESFFLRRFDRVSTISDAMQSKLLKKGVPAERACQLPNWVSLDGVYPLPSSSTLRTELGIADDEIVALYSGNMGEKQGLEIIIEAAQRLQGNPKIRFLMVGSGSARPKLEGMASHLPNVSWLPLQPLNRLNALLGTADVHLLPQRADAADLVMPSKLTGMLASGRAVVGTAAPTTQLGTVLDEVGVRVLPDDVDGFAHAIESLAMDAPRRQRLAALGRSYAEQKLDKDVILHDFLAKLSADMAIRYA